MPCYRLIECVVTIDVLNSYRSTLDSTILKPALNSYTDETVIEAFALDIFLVGGAVRDFLLAKLENSFQSQEQIDHYWNSVEKDWVVVGTTSEEMLALGYRPVGKSFPVFLHPETKEEYALARIERKTGKGYTGFDCYAAPDVTLEQDLKRRDLTINAISMKFIGVDFSNYTIIDPYQGIADLEKKLFRHVSLAFSEDPVRILRVARLACRFQDFEVAPETYSLMSQMVSSGEVDALVPERVWQEWARSLSCSAPWRFFDIIEACGASEKILPGIDVAALNKKALSVAVQKRLNKNIMLAIELYHMPISNLRPLLSHYKIPNALSELCLLVAEYYPFWKRVEWTPSSILTLFEKTDAFRRQERFEDFLTTCEILISLDQANLSRPSLRDILEEILAINNRKLLEEGLQGLAFATELRRLRLAAIEKFVASCH